LNKDINLVILTLPDNIRKKKIYPYPEFKELNLSKIISFNKGWEHHALGFLFSVVNKNLGKLDKIYFKEW